MTDYATLQPLILSTFDTDFSAAEPSVAITYRNQNEEGTQPDALGEYVYVAFGQTFGAARTGTGLRGIGERDSHHRGRLIVDIYTPFGDGGARSSAIKDSCVTIFQGKAVGGATFLSHETQPIGKSHADPRFWKEAVAFPFIFDYTPA